MLCGLASLPLNHYASQASLLASSGAALSQLSGYIATDRLTQEELCLHGA